MSEDITKVLKRANDIQKEIKEIESFLLAAERTWNGKLNKRVEYIEKFFIKSNSYGIFEECELQLNTDLKNKMINILKVEVIRLKKEMTELLIDRNEKDD